MHSFRYVLTSCGRDSAARTYLPTRQLLPTQPESGTGPRAGPCRYSCTFGTSTFACQSGQPGASPVLMPASVLHLDTSVCVHIKHSTDMAMGGASTAGVRSLAWGPPGGAYLLLVAFIPRWVKVIQQVLLRHSVLLLYKPSLPSRITA